MKKPICRALFIGLPLTALVLVLASTNYDPLDFLNDLEPVRVKATLPAPVQNTLAGQIEVLRFKRPPEEVGARLGVKANSIRFVLKQPGYSLFSVKHPDGKHRLFFYIPKNADDHTCQVWMASDQPSWQLQWFKLKRRLGL